MGMLVKKSSKKRLTVLTRALELSSSSFEEIISTSIKSLVGGVSFSQIRTRYASGILYIP